MSCLPGIGTSGVFGKLGLEKQECQGLADSSLCLSPNKVADFIPVKDQKGGKIPAKDRGPSSAAHRGHYHILRT